MFLFDLLVNELRLNSLMAEKRRAGKAERKYMTAMQNANMLASQEQRLFTEIAREHKNSPKTQLVNKNSEPVMASPPKQANK